jgi:DNA-binding IclR family transcriptional regulator
MVSPSIYELFKYEKCVHISDTIRSTSRMSAQDSVTSTHYSVPPVSRAFALLHYIGEGNRCRNASQAAKAIGINRTTLIRLLVALQEERMIEKIPEDGGYRLGTGLITLASQVFKDRNIVQVARPFLHELVKQLNLSAHLCIREEREIVYLARETPQSQLVSNVREGTRLPAHATNIGRIMLADLSPKALRELYDGVELSAYTPQTSTSLDELEERLRKDRAIGIAWSMAHFEPEIGSAAVALRDYRKVCVGAINVTGHASIFAPDSKRLPEIEVQLKAAAEGVSRALGYTP